MAVKVSAEFSRDVIFPRVKAHIDLYGEKNALK